MRITPIRVDDIVIGERHRALSDDAVQRLATSMRDIGLMQPVTVRVVEEMELDGELTAGVPILVAGAHRLAAAKSLGWSHIDCVEVQDDEITAELCEIAENLHRYDLTKEQRDQHIRRYAELLTQREAARTSCPTSLSDGRKAGPQHRPGIASQVAADTGLSQRTVRRALNPAPPPEPKPAMPDYDVVTVQFNALMGAWNRAGPEARERFLAEVDAPVFDQGRCAA